MRINWTKQAVTMLVTKMAEKQLSEAEVEFVIEHADCMARSDGRTEVTMNVVWRAVATAMDIRFRKQGNESPLSPNWWLK